MLNFIIKMTFRIQTVILNEEICSILKPVSKDFIEESNQKYPTVLKF